MRILSNFKIKSKCVSFCKSVLVAAYQHCSPSQFSPSGLIFFGYFFMTCFLRNMTPFTIISIYYLCYHILYPGSSHCIKKEISFFGRPWHCCTWFIPEFSICTQALAVSVDSERAEYSSAKRLWLKSHTRTVARGYGGASAASEGQGEHPGPPPAFPQWVTALSVELWASLTLLWL